MDASLTICIPTFNRWESLKRLLHSIFQQERSNEVIVLICDNCSSYPLSDYIYKEFHDQEKREIKIIKNKYNIGGDANIASLFLHCDTDWMWMIGDDDEVPTNALSNILEDIERPDNADVVMYKYSIERFPTHPDVDVNTIQDFIRTFIDYKCTAGDFIFLSNNVYNMKIAGKTYSNTLQACYCAVSQLLPALFALQMRMGTIRLRSTSIIRYLPPQKGTDWNQFWTGIRICSIGDVFTDIKHDEYLQINRFVLQNFNHCLIAKTALGISDRKMGKCHYDKIYKNGFKNNGMKNFAIRFIYLVSYYTHCDFFKLLGQ